ncbi:MAG: HAD-IIIA family hydrolase [Blastocatellia bacterium]|nr:HAD-IIIA family hydrolase [Blastocatellia bacterium]MBN8722273.1 HAD-IIIA family hydrolase [Acidobacteriota bacterium]
MKQIIKKQQDNILTQANSIKLILMDCDGVLTDGQIILLPDGEEIKNFHVLDGQGVALAKQAGLKVGVISGRQSKVLTRRAKEGSYDFLFDKVSNKLAIYENLLVETGLKDHEIAFIGDDLPDIAIMCRVGLAIAVANAVDEVKNQADLITTRSGGQGAVREAIEFILKSQGLWQELIKKY